MAAGKWGGFAGGMMGHRIHLGEMVLSVALTAAAAASAQSRDSTPAFQDVAEILNDRCVVCHSGPGAPLG